MTARGLIYHGLFTIHTKRQMSVHRGPRTEIKIPALFHPRPKKREELTGYFHCVFVFARSLFNYLGPVSRKPRKRFGPAKPFSIVRILKTKKCIGMKLCVKGKFVHIKNMWKEQLCKLKVWDFCCGFPGPKTFRDLRETGPCSFSAQSAHFFKTSAQS